MEGAQTTTTTYDANYHTLVTQVQGPAVGAYTPTETREYYEVNESNSSLGSGLPGQVKRVYDVNNATSTWYQYDSFGRLLYRWLPGDTAWSTGYASQAYGYDLTARRLYTRQRDDAGAGSPSYLESWQFYDGLGRLIQSQSEGRNSNEIVLVDAHYDARGLQEKVTVAQYWTVPGGTFRDGHWNGTYPGVTTTYDTLGRTLRVTQPDGTWTEHHYGVASNRLYDDVLDANRHRSQVRYDSLGRLAMVYEMSGNCSDSYWDYSCSGEYTTPWAVYALTTYSYDRLDHLTSVTDAVGYSNVTTMDYDLLGLKISMHDPDMGNWAYEYDALGNLENQTDAKGQIITFTHDALNRLTVKEYPSGSKVYYQYDNVKDDAPAKKSWGRLRLTYVGSESANGHLYEYDARGRVVKEQVKIDSVTYDTGYTYDAADRVRTMTYPDGEVVNTTYNTAGLPATLTGAAAYVDGATYNALGQPTLVTYGGAGLDVQTQYTYYSDDQRLQRLQVGIPTWVGRDLSLEYTYDPVGNVLTLTDANVAGGAQTQSFGYDARDRLTQATATGGNAGQGQYSEAYSYNAIGNLTSKGGVSYTYPASGGSSVRPHAVSSTGNGGSFSYDANGNMTSRQVKSGDPTYVQTWDYENRLATVTGNGRTTAFTYDGEGALVKKAAYENLAVGIPATCSATLTWPGVVTNDDTWANSGSNSSGEFAHTYPYGLQYVQLDLGAAYSVDQVKVWHYAGDGRTYHNTKTQVSGDGVTWYTVFDSAVSGEYAETAAGKTHSFEARSVRYVRDYLNGSTANAGNHWVEIEVWGARTVVYAGPHYEVDLGGEVDRFEYTDSPLNHNWAIVGSRRQHQHRRRDGATGPGPAGDHQRRHRFCHPLSGERQPRPALPRDVGMDQGQRHLLLLRKGARHQRQRLLPPLRAHHGDALCPERLCHHPRGDGVPRRHLAGAGPGSERRPAECVWGRRRDGQVVHRPRQLRPGRPGAPGQRQDHQVLYVQRPASGHEQGRCGILCAGGPSRLDGDHGG